MVVEDEKYSESLVEQAIEAMLHARQLAARLLGPCALYNGTRADSSGRPMHPCTLRSGRTNSSSMRGMSRRLFVVQFHVFTVAPCSSQRFEDLPAGTTTNGATQLIVVEFLVVAVLALQGVEGTD